MERVLAGSEDDLRWRPLSPTKPQTEKPHKKKKKSQIIKELTDKNTALRNKLNEVIDENIQLRAKYKEPVPKPDIKEVEVIKPAPKIEKQAPKREIKPQTVKKVVKKVAQKTARTRRR